jgi:hypothetical protein
MTCSVAKAAPATGYLLRNVPPHVAYRSVRIGHLLRRTRAGRIPRALRQATRNAPRSHRRNAPRGGREDVASIDKASLVDYGNRCAPAGSTRQVVGRARGTPVRHGEYRESRDDRLSESPAARHEHRPTIGIIGCQHQFHHGARASRLRSASARRSSSLPVGQSSGSHCVVKRRRISSDRRGQGRRNGRVGDPLLDHLIRAQQHRRRNGEPERLGGLEVDDQSKWTTSKPTTRFL